MWQFCSIVDEMLAAIYWQNCHYGTVFISSALQNQKWLHFTFYPEGEEERTFLKNGLWIGQSVGSSKLLFNGIRFEMLYCYSPNYYHHYQHYQHQHYQYHPHHQHWKYWIGKVLRFCCCQFSSGSPPRGEKLGFNWEKCNTYVLHTSSSSSSSS